MRHHWAIARVLLGLLVVQACQSAAPSSSQQRVQDFDISCTPGATRACAGAVACQEPASQVCFPTGEGWSACACPRPTGGAGGDSGIGLDAGGPAGAATSGGGGDPGGTGTTGDTGSGGEPTECEPEAPVTAMLDVYGSVSYFAGGAELAAGHYQVRYLDGCMRYGKNGGWTVHASELGTATAYLATETVEEWAVLPGTFGDRVGKGAFEEFAECVTANQRLDPVPFDFEGGVLGVGLVDPNYADNVPGADGVSPSWELQQLGTCGDQ